MAVEDVKNPASPCTLPYPDRYHAAVSFAANLPKGTTLSEETRLVLYALHQQAAHGPCKESKPWSWNPVENAKWQSWKSLGSMAPMEAMRLYVRTLEEEQPDWYVVQKKSELEESGGSSADSPQSAISLSKEGLWAAVPTSGPRKPVPRYEQGAVLLGSKLYVVGGNYGGRYLNDVWMFDTESREWQLLSTKADETAAGTIIPPCAGHTVVAWKDGLYIIGGHIKAKDAVTSVQVRLLDLKSLTWSSPAISGTPPQPRGGHSAALVGNKVYVFGGEDVGRRALGDFHVLDLETMSWSQPETKGKLPPARAAHTAACYKNRYLLIFGGGSVAMCYNDFHMLDLETMEWTRPAVTGVKPTPRAGHAASLLGDAWYIVGGGNNVKGCTDMLVFDLAVLDEGRVKCLVQTSIPPRDPLSSEGISLLSTSSKVLIAFGGYNGKYHNAVSVFKAPPLPPVDESSYVSVEQKDVPAAGKKPTKEAAAPPAAVESKDVAKPPEKVKVSDSPTELRVQLEAAWKEAENATHEATAAKEAAAHELALMRRQLNTAQTSLAESQKSLEEAKQQLQSEEAKRLKLEAEIAELQKKLAAMQDLEKEMEKYRRQDKEREAQAKKGTGIWGYIAGQ